MQSNFSQSHRVIQIIPKKKIGLKYTAYFLIETHNTGLNAVDLLILYANHNTTSCIAIFSNQGNNPSLQNTLSSTILTKTILNGT
jgi:hypothetical protein